LALPVDYNIPERNPDDPEDMPGSWATMRASENTPAPSPPCHYNDPEDNPVLTALLRWLAREASIVVVSEPIRLNMCQNASIANTIWDGLDTFSRMPVKTM
jgi:hypothetical protein